MKAKRLTALLTALLLGATAVYAAPAPELTENTAEPAAAEEKAELMTVFGNDDIPEKILPGVNILTNTTKPLSDKSELVHLRYDGNLVTNSWGTETQDPLDSDNTCFVVGGSNYPQLKFKIHDDKLTNYNDKENRHYPYLTPGKWRVSFSGYRTSADGKKVSNLTWLFATPVGKAQDGNYDMLKDGAVKFEKTEGWQEYSFDIEPDDNYFFFCFQFNMLDPANEKIYVDNFSIVPAHTVTYKDSTGENILATSQEFLTVGGEFTPVVTESQKESGIYGWSTEPGGDKVSSVPVACEDITLYAVYRPLLKTYPNVNILSGTTAGYDGYDQPPYQDDDMEPVFSVIGAEFSSSEDAGETFPITESGNNFFKVTGNFFPGLTFNFKNRVPAGKYVLSMDLCRGNSETADNDSKIVWVVINGNNEEAFTVATDFGYSDSWKNYTCVIDSADVIKTLKIQFGQFDGNRDFYIDNVSVIPYQAEAPVSINGSEIRTTSENGGLRFKAYVTEEQRDDADEYGFMVALADKFGGNYTGFVFPEGFESATDGETQKVGKTVGGVTFICQSNYVKNGSVDKFAMDGANFAFSAVLTGMTTKQHYQTEFAVRPYVRIGDTYYYGSVQAKNIYDVAKTLRANATESTPESVRNYYQSIIDVVEASEEADA